MAAKDPKDVPNPKDAPRSPPGDDTGATGPGAKMGKDVGPGAPGAAGATPGPGMDSGPHGPTTLPTGAASAGNPGSPGGAPGATTGAENPNPSSANRPAVNADENDPGRRPQNTTGAAPTPSGAPPHVSGGASDDTSVRSFVDTARSALGCVTSGDWSGALRNTGKLLSVATDLFGLPNIFGGTEEDAKAEAELDRLTEECRAAKDTAIQHAARGRKLSLGGTPHHTTGAAPAMAVDPKGIDPAMIMTIVELISQLLKWIHDRRHPPTP